MLTQENNSCTQLKYSHQANKTGRSYHYVQIQFGVLHVLEIRNFLLYISTFISLMGIFHLFKFGKQKWHISSLIYFASRQSGDMEWQRVQGLSLL